MKFLKVLQQIFWLSLRKSLREFLERRSTHRSGLNFGAPLRDRSGFRSVAPKIAPLRSGAPKLWLEIEFFVENM